MLNNIGTADRTIRIVVGVGIAVVGVVFHTWWGLLALVPLVTAAVGFCPLYVPFKISTARKTGTKKA
jgi:type IV secretory pathway TrbD component